MRNFIKLFGIIAFVTIIGLSMTACDTDGGGDDGSIEINGWRYKVDNDKGDGGTSTIAMSRDGNKLTVTGNLTKECSNGSYGFSTLQMFPNANLLSQLKTSTGFYFDITGDGNTYYFQVVTSDVKDYGYYRVRFTTENGVQKRITVYFSDLTQPSWATPVQAHTNNITGLEISINTEFTNEGPYNFTLLVE